MVRIIRYHAALFALLLFSTVSGFCQNNVMKPSMKGIYFQWIEILGIVFLILMIWEIVDWFFKRKMHMTAVQAPDQVSLVEEHDDDPFKTLLREETASSSAPAPAPAREKEEVKIVDSREDIDAIKEDYRPALSDDALVSKEDGREKPRKIVQVEASTIERKEPEAEKKKIPVSGGEPISEDGWRELMQRATEESEETTIKGKPEEEKAPSLTPVPAPEAEEEEEDPWKALMKKSKQENVGVREEEKPWSMFLKSDREKKEKAAKDTEEQPEEAIESGAQISDKEISDIFSPAETGASDSEKMAAIASVIDTAAPAAQEEEEAAPVTQKNEKKEEEQTGEKIKISTPSDKKKKGIPLVIDEQKSPDEDMKKEKKRDKIKDKETKAIDLDVSRKKEEVPSEKKSGSQKKKAQSPFTRKASKVISLSSPSEEKGGREGADEKGK